MLGCEGDGDAGVGSGGGVVAVSAYMGGTRGSGVFSSAGDVLEMSVVIGVGGVCDMGKVGYESVFWSRWCGWCWGRVGWRFGPGSGRVGW